MSIVRRRVSIQFLALYRFDDSVRNYPCVISIIIDACLYNEGTTIEIGHDIAGPYP